MKVHIVEDDRVFNKLIKQSLALHSQLEIKTFFDGKSFINELSDYPDIVTLDIGLPDISGKEVFNQIKKHTPDTKIIIISGQDCVATAVNLLKKGAYDYITKDENVKERLLHCIKKISHKRKLLEEIPQPKDDVSQKYDFNNAIIGNSQVMKEVFNLTQKAINVPNINVSVYGASGTGKKLIAKTIHFNSIRKNNPFITVNMSAIPNEHIESELFGYEKGAYKGALMTKKGKFEEAEGGTIFFDEIGEMNSNLQAKLLRVIQEREITRIGGNKPVKVNARIISATNKDLRKEVQRGNFRADLYFRLLGLPIYLPSLRDRKNDIIRLSQFFLNNFCNDNKLEPMTFAHKAKKKLLGYSFPGNVRELKTIIELSAVMASDRQINEENIIFTSNESASHILAEELTLKEYTEHIIRHHLRKNNNNVLLVAKKLNVGKSTIYNMIKRKKQLTDT
jgi:DNA-binding NtrC family response regulator